MFKSIYSHQYRKTENCEIVYITVEYWKTVILTLFSRETGYGTKKTEAS